MYAVLANRKWCYAGAIAGVFLLVITARFSPPFPECQAGWFALLPPLVAIVLALVTRRIYLSLLLAILVGSTIAASSTDHRPGVMLAYTIGYFARFVVSPLVSVEQLALDWTNILILAYVVFIMVAIAVVMAAGGLDALAGAFARFTKSRRSSQMAAFLAGLAVFVDDYANTMIIGSTFRPVTDRFKVSRAKLAFIVDATAAPVAGLAFISTWIGYEVGLLDEIARSLHIGKGGYEIFLSALGFRFYCLGMLMFVPMCVLLDSDFGPMSRVERRLRQHSIDSSRLSSEMSAGFSAKSSEIENEKVTGRGASQCHDGLGTGEINGGLDGVCITSNISAWAAVFPLSVLLAVFVIGLWISGGGSELLKADGLAWLRPSAWRTILTNADSIAVLAMASLLCLLCAVLAARIVARIAWTEVLAGVYRGLQAASLPVSVLLLAWALKRVCDVLQTGAYLAGVLSGTVYPPLFPVLVFTVACGCAFATGTSWGTMAILLPTALPVAFALDGNQFGQITLVSAAAVLDGAIFGDHCSPISDTTIMSAAAAGCHPIAHVRTQLPYAVLVAAVVTVAAYLPAGFGVAAPVSWIASFCLLLAILAAVSRRKQRM